nr:Chain B, Myelin transcription factor 1 [Homo sapiens]7Q45_D Chain D, Myelin transcription factor 1 [Homo sapiens]7Q45_F Chain F, Myelin transcription factor 1 [Homo sapiens]
RSDDDKDEDTHSRK